MTNNYQKRGVVILFAILLVSIVLTVGLTLLNITLRQLVLSSLARESQFAFYAADSARNCARYYDSIDPADQRPFGYFTTSGGLLYVPPTVTSLDCGASATMLPAVDGPDTITFKFVVAFNDGANPAKTSCANVTIVKFKDTGKTDIKSRGYNSHGSNNFDCYQPGDRTVERASSMVY